MKFIKLSIAAFSFCFSLQSFANHGLYEIPTDFNEGAEVYLNIIRSDKFNLDTCSPILDSLYHEITSLEPTYFDLNSLEENYEATINRLWSSRLALRGRLKSFAKQTDINDQKLKKCVRSIRSALRITRYIEDYLGEYLFDKKIKSTHSEVPLSGEFPQLLKSDESAPVKIQSGDVLLSRGNAYASAAIARIGDVDVQFSHVAFVYIKGEPVGTQYTYEEAIKKDNVLVLEAHIEIGSTILPFKDYLKANNTRTLQFRYKDPTKAHLAAKASHTLLVNHKEKSFEKLPFSPKDSVNHNMPYDFKMKMGDSSEIFCSEMASYGFNQIGIDIPTFKTELPKNNALLDALGVKSKSTFAPGDMDVSVEFNLLAEWRHFKRIANIRQKDAVLTKMFEWMENENYKFKPTLADKLKARLAWVLRRTDGKKVSKQLPLNMNTKIITSMIILDRTGELLQNYINEQEELYKQSHAGLPMSYIGMLKALEEFKTQGLLPATFSN